MMRIPCKPLLTLAALLFAFSLAAAERGIKRVELRIPSGETLPLYSESHALVIGVSDYQDPRWPDLESVREDVSTVKQALTAHGFRVVTVLDPTAKELKEAVAGFIGEHGYADGNRLLFYYSGHGFTQTKGGRQIGYLVPTDAPSPVEDERGFFRKSVKMTQMLSWARQIESKHALFLFDSCFSGAVLKTRAAAVPEDISYLTSRPVRQFISAGAADQPVPALSVFRPLFIRGINGKADLDQDGYVTGTELGMYLQKRVPHYETGQTPQYDKLRDPALDEGNFVFVVPSAKKLRETARQEKQESEEATLYWHVKSKQWKTTGDPKRDGVFVGSVRDGVPHGKGIYTYTDGGEYAGHYRNGRRHGQGTYTSPDGRSYAGAWWDGRFHGQGTHTWPSGAKFVGEFRNGKRWAGIQYDPQGRKKSIWAKGATKQAQPEKTTLYLDVQSLEWKTKGDKNTDGVYVGEIRNGTPHGQGILTWPDGSKYVGAFKNGNYHGQGTMAFADGFKYVGEWKNDKYHGQGSLTDPNGAKYVGSWKYGKENGQGTLIYASGAKHVGRWKDGKKHGWGTYTHPIGEGYDGEYKDGSPHGEGTYTYPDGSKFFGEFKNGKPWDGIVLSGGRVIRTFTNGVWQ